MSKIRFRPTQQNDAVTITDADGDSVKVRDIRSISKGGKRFVEFLVLGAEHDWRNFMEHSAFVQANPHVSV
jgi:hypothetical protein